MNKIKLHKKALLGFIILASSSTLIGCGQSVNSLTDEEKTEIRNTILLHDSSDKDSIDELEQLIDKNITYFNQKDKDDMIMSYISNHYTLISDLKDKLTTIGYELEDVVELYGVDVHNPSTYKKIPDTHATVKGFLTELDKKGFTLNSDSDVSAFYVSVDLSKVLNKYGSHMSKSLKAYVEFCDYEIINNDTFDEDKLEYDLTEVCERILKLENGLSIDKEQNYDYADKWTSLLEDYYYILFGIDHDYFISTGYIKDSIIEKYKSLAENNKGTNLEKNINEILDILKDNGRRFDEVTRYKIKSAIEHNIYIEEVQNAINLKDPSTLIDETIEDNPEKDNNETSNKQEDTNTEDTQAE